MSIEQHQAPEAAPQAAPAESGADLARLLDGLTRVVLDLPDADPAELAELAEESVALEPEQPATDVPEPRRRANVLGELGFLDD